MEQSKQTEDTKTALSVHLSVQINPVIPNPKCCLAQPVFWLSYYQVRRLMKLSWRMEKLLLVGCLEGQFEFWQQEIWKEVPLLPLFLGGRIHKYMAPGRGGSGVQSSVSAL